MFKKTLLAATLLATFGASAAVVTPVAGNQTISVEGSQSAATPKVTIVHGATDGNALDTDSISAIITTASDYIVNDVISITVTGGTVDTASVAILTEQTKANLITASLIDIVGNVIRFRVDTQITSGTAMYLNDVVVGISGATKATNISVSSTAISSSNAIGQYDASPAVKVADFANQTSAAFTNKFNGVIDVESKRASFAAVTVVTGDVDEDGAALLSHIDDQDSLVITVTDAAGIQELGFDAGSLTVQAEDLSVYSSFDVNENGVLTGAELTGSAGVTSIDLATNIITTAWAFGDLDAAYTVTLPKAPTDEILVEQSFLATITATEAGVASATLTDVASGAWTLNGSTDDIAFLPFGADYKQSITVTNTGTVEGEITIDLTAEGTTYSTTLTAAAAAKSVTNISLEVAAFAAESGITGNARVNVVVNAPDANIAVKGVYYHKASADRVVTY